MSEKISPFKPENTDNQTDETKRKKYGVDRKTAVLATVLSAGLHVGAADMATGSHVKNEAVVQATKAKRATKDMFAESKAFFSENQSGVSSFKEGLETAARNGKAYDNEELGLRGIEIQKSPDGKLEIKDGQEGRVDWLKFFLAHEVSRGIVDKKMVEAKGESLEEEIKKYQELSKKTYPQETADFEGWKRRIIFEIVNDQGDFDPEQPNLNEMVLTKQELEEGKKKHGDCKARLKRNMIIISKVFPGMEIKVQISKDPHRRLLVNLANDVSDPSWYIVEDAIDQLKEEDIEGTVIVGPMNFLRAKFGAKKEGNLIPSSLSPDKAYDQGLSDGFDLLPPGLSPTNNVFKGRYAPSQYSSAKKLSFVDAQKNSNDSDVLQVTYLDADKLGVPPDLKDASSGVETVRFSPKQVLETKMAADFDCENRLVTAEDPDLLTTKEFEQRQKFNAASHTEQTKMIEGKVLDLTPFKDTPLKKLRIVGYKADLNQLNNLSELREVEIDSSIVIGLEKLAQASHLERFVWDGQYYAVENQGNITNEINAAVRQAKELSELELDNFPIENAPPLATKKLRKLRLFNTKISKLDVYSGMPLEELTLNRSLIRDLLIFKNRLDEGKLKVNGGDDWDKLDFNYTTYKFKVDEAKFKGPIFNYDDKKKQDLAQ